MRRITMWLLVTATVFALLFSYHTSTDSGVTAVAALATAPTTTSATASSTQSPATPAATSTTTPTSTPTASSATQTFTGSSVDTRWGPVQVQITVVAGKITAATAIVYPENNHRDEEINAEALPILQQETVAAQNAKIDMVSGATVTSSGYITSLQSAIDQANLG